MHIGVSGTGPALVMVHGWAMHGGIFATLCERLQSRYTLHIVDLPGHGRSRNSTVPLTLDAVAQHISAQTPPAIWLGWSLGGLVALHAAQSYAASLRGLVMVCASPRFVNSKEWPEGMPASVFSQFAADLGSDYQATLDRFLMLEALGSDHRRSDFQMLREAVFEHGKPDPGVLEQGLALLRDSDLRAGLGSLAMPSLWLAGRRDRLVTPQAMQRAASLAPRAQFMQVEGGGHAPFLSHADEVQQALDGFADQVLT